ncbi:hypothetical protein ANN_09905 [Periplaneta americana]|uniref:Uncharacterized protein n=1 Tax=Periplaneta americana TaxID=6978 RepID=A0ABQ8TML1_PERAM|nr:hypothetical protein ANN_09905 [Periplaneta americana]
MGSNHRETREETRKVIIKLHNQSKSLREISELVGRPRPTIQSIYDRFSASETVENKPRTGRPKVLTEQNERVIIREIKKDPKIIAVKVVADLERRVNPKRIKLVWVTGREGIAENYTAHIARERALKLFVGPEHLNILKGPEGIKNTEAICTSAAAAAEDSDCNNNSGGGGSGGGVIIVIEHLYYVELSGFIRDCAEKYVCVPDSLQQNASTQKENNSKSSEKQW